MCRMMALRDSDPASRRTALEAFRTQASAGRTGPPTHRVHPDGWGIAARVHDAWTHLGRSPRDASTDPAYDDAARSAATARPDAFLLAHVRNASVGGSDVRNNQPFLRDGWAFAHNGTIYGIQAPPGAHPDGETDSERFFLHILDAVRRTASPEAAIADVVPRIAAAHPHSSLTFLLTDGARLYAMRRVGPDQRGCRPLDAAFSHYTLHWSSLPEGGIVVVQERHLAPAATAWTEIPDGHLLVADGVRPPRLVPILGPSVTELRPVPAR